MEKGLDHRIVKHPHTMATWTGCLDAFIHHPKLRAPLIGDKSGLSKRDMKW
jgi:hypothetical protein